MRSMSRSCRVHAGHEQVRICVLALVAFALCLVVSGPTHAWKGQTHIFVANQAIEPIIAGGNAVQINGESYDVDPRVASAIRHFPQFYRAGAIGPDAYPDVYVGQARIHPDTRAEDVEGVGYGYSYTYEWLRHVYEGGWHHYNENIGTDAAAAEQALAFTYGFLVHAVSDIWGHTLINDYARGIWPAVDDLADPANLNIVLRHVVVESYVDKRVPETSLEIDTPQQFVHNTLMAGGADLGLGGEPHGFIDSANQDAASIGRGQVLDYFFELRNALELRHAAIEAMAPWHPLKLLYISLGVENYLDNWIEDIDDGLREWPDMSDDIARAVFATSNPDFDAASARVDEMLWDHVYSMIGVPDVILDVLELFGDILASFYEEFEDELEPLIEPLKQEAEELRNYVIEKYTGIDIEELKEYVLHPENHINSPAIGLGPGTETSDALDAAMGIEPGGEAVFDPAAFVPIANSITISKIVLLSPDQLNLLLYNHRVGPIYSDDFPYSDRANMALGYVRSIDGHQQWRRATIADYPNSPAGTVLSEGMPLWNDCLARERVFRVLFTDWQNDEFPTLGEDPVHLSATPPPTSKLDMTGRSYAVGDVVYVRADTEFQVAAVADHFWNLDEIWLSGSVVPGGPVLAGPSPVVLGSLSGPDGVYSIMHNATGLCIEGPPYGETPKLAEFTLDQTPPDITVTSPGEGQVLDVVDTVVVHFSAADTGAGLDTLTAEFDGTIIHDGDTVDAFLLAAGDHQLVVTAADKLGNDDTLVRTFEVHATIPGLRAAWERARAEQLVTLPPKDIMVFKTLARAEKNLASSKFHQVANALEGLSYLVAGQSGGGVDPVFAGRYIGWIDDYIARL